MDVPDIHEYVRKVNENGRPCRAVDVDTGEIIGESCSICATAHLGLDGSCLL